MIVNRFPSKTLSMAESSESRHNFEIIHVVQTPVIVDQVGRMDDCG